MRRRWSDDTKVGSDSEPKVVFSGQGGWDTTTVCLGCLALRLLNALLVRTYFNPDEHWQALEVAHRIVFGYGHMSWEWSQGLRSYLHPLIFAALYKLLQAVNLDTIWFMTRAPRLVQAILAAFGDLYVFKLGCRIFNKRTAQWALFCQLTNWFTFFCIVRTFSNSLETVLTVVALYYWPIPGARTPSARRLALAVAALACVIRPTNAIIWVYMGILHVVETQDKLQFLLLEVLPIGLFSLGATCVLDSWMYGRLTFVPWNFMKFNFLSSGGDFYGTHPWHWYFSQGFPAMVFSFLPVSAAGIWWSGEWVLSGLIAWTLCVYSMLGHKEFRFVLPLLPLAMLFAGYSLFILEPLGNFSNHSASKRHSKTLAREVQHCSPARWIALGLLLTNVPVALYTSLVHQRGSEAVMEYLAEQARGNKVESVIFLMPCHATPFYSSLHKNVPMRFLDCSPSDVAGYVDEADQFMAQPLTFLSAQYEGDEKSLAPSHVVLFDSLLPRVTTFLEKHGYEQVQRLFHSHIPVDRELQGYVLVFARNTRD